jgi:predicted DsbA family dithiol-disulfide isomerase
MLFLQYGKIWKGIKMSILEVYFDYACPYCLKVHDDLLELLERYPAIEVEWRACEAHPRPEVYSRYSDLLARGMYIAQNLGADILEYHRLIYNAAIVQRIDIECPDTVADAVASILDRDEFIKALNSGMYADKLAENNRLAWAEYDFPAVPSYRMGGVLLKSVPGVGIGREQIEELLHNI